MMKKYLNKICIACYLIFSVFVLSLFFAWYNGRNVITDNGSGRASVYVDIDDVETRFSDLKSYEKHLKLWAEQVNNSSKDDDCFFFESVEKSGSEYRITFKFRRISTVGTSAGFGLLGWQRLADVFNYETEKLSFQKFLNGNFSGVFYRIDADGIIRDVEIEKGKNDYRYAIINADTNTEMDFDRFERENKAKNLVLASFKIIDVSNVNRIVVNFDSKIRHYSSQGVKLLDENTAEIMPTIYKVKKLSADGKKYEEIETKCAIGYLTVDRNILNAGVVASPFVLLILGFIVMEVLVKLGLGER